MPYEIWLAFVVASTVLLLVPGPTVMVVLGYAMAGGPRTGRATVPGTMLGDLTAMTISLLGAGAVLAASATLFTVLKLVGAAYLVWLGIQMWRRPPTTLAPSGGAVRQSSQTGMFWKAYVVTALNPKGIVFFVAFVPQFIDPGSPILFQAGLLTATFVVLAGINVALWAILAGEMRSRLQSKRALRIISRLGGGFLIGAGAFTAAARRIA